jgi:hypothetical protein
MEPAPPAPEVQTRESIRVQALLAEIGARMGMAIWIPRADRGAVLKEWKNEDTSLIDRLPLNYDDTTLRTIEQIGAFTSGIWMGFVQVDYLREPIESGRTSVLAKVLDVENGHFRAAIPGYSFDTNSVWGEMDNVVAVGPV